MTEQVVDFEGKPFVITFFKGIPPSASEVYLFLLDDGSVHQGVIDYSSTVFPQGAVSTTNPIGGFHEKNEIPLRRVAGYASAGPQYDTRERSIWLAANFLTKEVITEARELPQPDQSVLGIPEATLEQLGLAKANFGFPFEPQYCAMDDGIDCPGGCWHLFEDLPSFDPITLSWQAEGNAWEIGVDDSDDLHDTPEFQRQVKAGFSLVRVVKVTTASPQYHPQAYMTPPAEETEKELNR